VIVIDRLVRRSAFERADQRIDRVDAGAGCAVAEIVRHGFPNQRGHTHPPTTRAVRELVVLGFRQPQVGRDVTGHSGTTVSRYLQARQSAR
jgi:hypothetical protein